MIIPRENHFIVIKVIMTVLMCSIIPGLLIFINQGMNINFQKKHICIMDTYIMIVITVFIFKKIVNMVSFHFSILSRFSVHRYFENKIYAYYFQVFFTNRFNLDPGGFSSAYTDPSLRGISTQDTNSSSVPSYPNVVNQSTSGHDSNKTVNCLESNKIKDLSCLRQDRGPTATSMPPPPLVPVNDYTTSKSHSSETSSPTHNS